MIYSAILPIKSNERNRNPHKKGMIPRLLILNRNDLRYDNYINPFKSASNQLEKNEVYSPFKVQFTTVLQDDDDNVIPYSSYQNQSYYKNTFPLKDIGYLHGYNNTQDSQFNSNSPTKPQEVTENFDETVAEQQYFIPVNEIVRENRRQDDAFFNLHQWKSKHIASKPVEQTSYRKLNYYRQNFSPLASSMDKEWFDRFHRALDYRRISQNHSSLKDTELYESVAPQNSLTQLVSPSISPVALNVREIGSKRPRNFTENELGSFEQTGIIVNSTDRADDYATSHSEKNYNQQGENVFSPIPGIESTSKHVKRQAYQAYQFSLPNVPPRVATPPVESTNIETIYEQTQVTPTLCSKRPAKTPNLTDYFPAKIETYAVSQPAAGARKQPVHAYRQIEISDTMLDPGLDLNALFKGVTVRDVYITLPVTMKSVAPRQKPTGQRRPMKPPPSRKPKIHAIVTTRPTTTFRTDEYETDDYETETDEPYEYYSHGPDTDIISDHYYYGEGITTVRTRSRGKRSVREDRNSKKNEKAVLHHQKLSPTKYRSGL